MSGLDHGLDRTIRDLILKGYDHFYIYPFGEIGMQVKEILEERYGISDYVLIDNGLCRFNKKILEFRRMKLCIKGHLIICGRGSFLYMSENLSIL